MDKKKILAIIAAVVLLFAVVILVVLTKSERPNENEKPSPTPVPTQSALPTDAPVPTAEVPVPTDAPTGTPAPTEVATPAPTDEPTPEPTQVAGATPTPALPQLWEEWKSQGLVEGESYAEDKTYVYGGHIPLDDGGFMEVYADKPGDEFFRPDFIYVFDTEEMPEAPKPESPYTKDKANGTVRCAFSVQVGDGVVMEFWTDGQIYLKGTGRTWDFPEVAPNETEFDHLLNRASTDYFVYNYVWALYNVSTGEFCETENSSETYSFDGTLTKSDFRTFLDSMRTIHIGSGITSIDRNVCNEEEKSVPGWCSGLTVVHD